MEEIPTGGIDLIVSGPPYWDYINFQAYCENPSEGYIWNIEKSYDAFLDDFRKWYQECFRVLRNGRFCVVNAGTIRRKGKCFAFPFHVVSIMEKIGFDFSHEIIWNKVALGRKHARGLIKHPYPGYFMPNNQIEYLLLFKKGKAPFYRDRDLAYREDNRLETDDFFKHEIANNIWNIMPVQEAYASGHPCPFPPEIPLRLIEYYSLKGDTVLDPFMGIGTTAQAARMLGRHYIGYELYEQFAELARMNANRDLPEREQLIMRYQRKSDREV